MNDLLIELPSVGLTLEGLDELRELRVEVMEELSSEDYDLIDKIAKENDIVLGDYDLCNDYDYGYGC